MLKTCSRPGAEKSGESVEEISTPGNLSRISRNLGKSETYRITDRPLKKAEAMGRGGVMGGRGGLHLNCQRGRPGHFYAHQLSYYCPCVSLRHTLCTVLLHIILHFTLLHAGMHCTVLHWTTLVHTVFCNSRSGTAVKSAACKHVISGVPHRFRQHFFAVTFIFCA